MKSRWIRSFESALMFPQPTSATLAVLSRHALHFRYSWIQSLFWVCFEPTVYFLIFGAGLGTLIGPIQDHSYLSFLFPGLAIASSSMVAFFESTYGLFTRLSQQKLISGMMMAPVRVMDIVLAEIIWATIKATIAVIFLIFIAQFMIPMNAKTALGIICFGALNAWVFAALGHLITALVQSFDFLFIFQTSVVMPMALICNTYFPMDVLPVPLQKVMLILPTTQASLGARALYWNQIDYSLFIHLGYLVAAALIFTNLANYQMRKALSK